MENTGYVALSRAAMLERATDVTANNIANANTIGFRAAAPLFESLMVRGGLDGDLKSMAYSIETATVSNLAPGGVFRTDNPLDVALPGSGWLAYLTPEGQTALGRDGQLALNEQGDLVTSGGDLVLDLGGAPITLPPDEANLTIAKDGTITADDGAVLGQIGIFEQPGIAGWQHLRGSLLVPREEDIDLMPALEPNLLQGHLEQSNVNPIEQMTLLINQQRAYERSMNMATVSDDLRKQTLSRLGPNA